MQHDTDSKVKAEFYFLSERLDFSDIDHLMGTPATSKRCKESFIYEEYAKDYWMLFTDYEVSEDINVQLNKLLNMLPDKNTINNICSQYNAQCGFLIVIERGRDDLLPGVYFERDFVKFASDIGAAINMDFV